MRKAVLCAGIAFILGCASHQFPVIHPVKKKTSEELARQRAESSFIRARQYDLYGIGNMAEYYYGLAYKFDPSSKELRNLLLEKYLQSEKYKQALLLIKNNRRIENCPDEDKRILMSLYIKMQELQKAVEVLEKVAQKSVLDYTTLGYLYERVDDFPRAIANYTLSLKGQKETAPLGMKLAELYIKEKRYAQAESIYVSLETKVENKKELFNGLGIVRLLVHDTVSAIDFFKTALIFDSTYLEALSNIAQIYIASDNFPKAIHYYEKMVAVDSRAGFYHKRTLALLYYYNKQYDKAIEQLQALLSKNISDYELHFFLGMALNASNQLDIAEIEFRKALALKPSFTEAWMHLCYLLLKKQEMDKAYATAKQFKENVPKSASAWHVYGYILSLNKKYLEAAEVLNKAIEYNEKDPVIWFEMGSVFERLGSYKKAADAFRNVLRLNPEDDAAANYLGYMWAEQGINLDSAKVLLEFALKKEPLNGAYLDSYAWIFYKKGDFDNAAFYIKKALEQIKNDPIIYEHWGDILSKKGEYNLAIDAFEKSIDLGAENKARINNKIKNLQNIPQKPIILDDVHK